MSVLTDVTIRNEISKGRLVPKGRPEFAEHCAYHFRPGKVFAPSSAEEIDWTVGGGLNSYRVKPGELVWVRTRETVELPHDVCAFWWQTNSLSKKGLMLVNMSMVEPGYRGVLACLFVNFGKDVTLIHRDEPIAKLVFHKLDASVEVPFSRNKNIDEYDRDLRNLMASGPQSFLRIAEYSTSFSEERERQRDALVKELKEESETALNQLRQDAMASFRKVFGLSAGAVLLLSVALLFTDWIRSMIGSDRHADQIAAAVAAELTRRTVYPGVAVPPASSEATTDDANNTTARSVDGEPRE